MVKVIGPLRSHWASGQISAPKVYSSSLRNRHDREAPPVPPPPSGGSLLFAITTDPCNAPTINHSNQYPGTIEVWIRPTAFKGFCAGTFFGTAIAGAMVGLDTLVINGLAAFASKFYMKSTAHSLTLNTWAHLAITWDVGLITIWENGISGNTHTGFAWTPSHHSGFQVGGQIKPTTPILQSYITRVRFSDIIRYTTNFTPATDFTTDGNTIGLWRMTEGAGTTVADESGNAHTLNFPAANLPTWSSLVP